MTRGGCIVILASGRLSSATAAVSQSAPTPPPAEPAPPVLDTFLPATDAIPPTDDDASAADVAVRRRGANLARQASATRRDAVGLLETAQPAASADMRKGEKPPVTTVTSDRAVTEVGAKDSVACDQIGSIGAAASCEPAPK